MALTKEHLLKVYRDMVLIRRFEEVVEKYSINGTIPGFIHLSIGQEAAQAGVIDALKVTDYKFPDHRGHGAIVLSSFPEERKRIMAEIFGKKTGINGGRGGSMHINDLSVRNMGFNGIQGSTVVTCLGTAFASVYNKTDDVTVVFMGDGTLGEGTCHESMNLAATWKLPVIYALINNQYAISTFYTDSHPQEKLSDWSKGYGVPGETVDGNDIEVVIEATNRAIERARKGEGPTLIEYMTYRWQGHFSGDPAAYRPDGELEKWKERCPLKLARQKLIETHAVAEKVIHDIHQEVEEEIEAYLQFSLESPVPVPEDSILHVYADDVQVEGRK
ncbi:MAG: thiamine pyrophosphate-dependent dehydrogenase E1 component subunit alpha [Anaerolineaceae bacterium]|nr:thiamine pyrophosphate-dependent dehydrogenase E1 component subunit alpha [Anaerolineaceae bacterium]